MAVLMALTTMLDLDAAIFALFVLFATALPGVDAVGYGLLLTAGAVGHIFGSLLSASVSQRFGAGRIVLDSVFVLGIVYLGLSLFHAPLLLGTLLVLDGFNLGLSGVGKVSLRQAMVPPDLRGWVGLTVSWSPAPPHSAQCWAGWWGQPLGLRETFAVAGGLALVVARQFVGRINNGAVVRAGHQIRGPSRLS
ncbi:MFS transporter [Deinococcus marmoris]|uniref:MFS transporter n=1 Tax=Deinococcus marmoris TaxID=249408 RepID=UPI0011152585|nr:MFS transporter [Deinococcus marmoris]